MAKKSEIAKAADQEMKRENGWIGWSDKRVEKAVKKKILGDFLLANIHLDDWSDEWHGKFSKEWRYDMGWPSRHVPFSTLLTVFHDRYGIPGGGEALVPLNVLTDNNNESNPHLDWDTMEENNNKNLDLDFDATKEILRRLPLPSLMRTKSVCKAWNTAIAASTFSLNDETDQFVMQDSSHGINFFCAALNQWFQIPFHQVLPLNKSNYDCKSTRFYLCAVAAGLFLFRDVYDNLVIIDLSTKQQRFLPRVSSWITIDAVELIVHADHFKIIIINCWRGVPLYNSTTDEWKEIPIMANFLEDFILNFLEQTRPWKTTQHEGMVYFTNNFGLHLGCYDIAHRDIQFKEIEGGLPPQIDSRDHVNNAYASLPCLVVCNGKLLLVGRLQKEAREESIWGCFPFIEHTLVGIWELDSRAENNESWSLISITPKDLLKDTVKSSHGTDFMVAASDKIWLTIKGSMYLLTLNLSTMEWNVLPGYTAADLAECLPSRAVCVPHRINRQLL